MPKSNVKYEIASQDADTSDYFLQHVQEFQNPSKKQASFWWDLLLTSGLIVSCWIMSIGLTFYQQSFLHEFHYPLGVVICHLFIKFILSSLARCMLECYKGQRRVRLSWHNVIWRVAAPGIVSGLDIGFSSWSLALITMSLYTMTKSTSIIFILGFAILFKLERKSWSLVGIVALIAGGLTMFTYKAVDLDVLGLLLCLLASFCSGLRWTLAQILMQKSKLGLGNPIDMMYHMQPWMLIAILPIALWYEGTKIYDGLSNTDWSDSQTVTFTFMIVIGGAVIAFFMEITEFLVITNTSSLTFSIAGIFKEMFQVLLAIELKGDQLNGLNFIGLLMCLSGIMLHVVQKILMKQKQTMDDLELKSNSVTSIDVKSDDGFETNQPLLTTQKSTSLTNLLNDDFSTDEDESKESSSQVLFNILQRREQ